MTNEQLKTNTEKISLETNADWSNIVNTPLKDLTERQIEVLKEEGFVVPPKILEEIAVRRLAEEKEPMIHLKNEENFQAQIKQMAESLLVGEKIAEDGVTIEEVVNNIFRITVKLSNGQTRVLVAEGPIKG